VVQRGEHPDGRKRLLEFGVVKLLQPVGKYDSASLDESLRLGHDGHDRTPGAPNSATSAAITSASVSAQARSVRRRR